MNNSVFFLLLSSDLFSLHDLNTLLCLYNMRRGTQSQQRELLIIRTRFWRRCEFYGDDGEVAGNCKNVRRTEEEGVAEGEREAGTEQKGEWTMKETLSIHSSVVLRRWYQLDVADSDSSRPQKSRRWRLRPLQAVPN